MPLASCQECFEAGLRKRALCIFRELAGGFRELKAHDIDGAIDPAQLQGDELLCEGKKAGGDIMFVLDCNA